uniref:Hypothetical conserved protein n=1 Tax=uncultured Chloroflexota bacterium TaxID=166587 RepID=H5SA67_9CHLR|nr:hypothetical conserved protein [uncultured Chloroflexota bacterium]
MTIEEAVQEIQKRIRTVSPQAEIKTVIISPEEARLSVYAQSSEMQAIKDATFQPILDLLNQHGLDVQVFVYEKM